MNLTRECPRAHRHHTRGSPLAAGLPEQRNPDLRYLYGPRVTLSGREARATRRAFRQPTRNARMFQMPSSVRGVKVMPPHDFGGFARTAPAGGAAKSAASIAAASTARHTTRVDALKSPLPDPVCGRPA